MGTLGAMVHGGDDVHLLHRGHAHDNLSASPCSGSRDAELVRMRDGTMGGTVGRNGHPWKPMMSSATTGVPVLEAPVLPKALNAGVIDVDGEAEFAALDTVSYPKLCDHSRR
jgi:hypothetical protein